MTLPKEVRDRFHLKPGDRIDIVVDEDRIVLLPAKITLDELCQILPRPKKVVTAAEMDRSVRDEAVRRAHRGK